MKVQIKKLWHGSTSIRDYLVEKCFKDGEDLEIEYEGKFMIVPNGMLMLGRRNHQKNVSQFKEEIYDLVDFFWVPTAPAKPKEPENLKLL